MIDLGINQRILAKRIGVSAAYISQIFTGERSLTPEIERRIKNELAELDTLSHQLCEAAGIVAENFSGIDDEMRAQVVADSAGKLLEALSELIDKRGSLLKQMSDADTKIKQKREAMLAIERENCMTVSAALRTIPKDVHKDDDDELLKVLRE